MELDYCEIAELLIESDSVLRFLFRWGGGWRWWEKTHGVAIFSRLPPPVTPLAQFPPEEGVLLSQVGDEASIGTLQCRLAVAQVVAS